MGIENIRRPQVSQAHPHAVSCSAFGKALEEAAIVVVQGQPSLTGAPQFQQGAAIALPRGGEIQKFRMSLHPFKYCPFCGKDLNPKIYIDG